MTDLILHELTGSPNSVKVRIALGYKGLDYERQPAELEDFPGDRTKIAELSRQPRYPVLQHGKVTLFDSGAILRYLESNFPDSPPIFSTDYALHAEYEEWESFARNKLHEPIGMVFSQAFSPEKDAAVLQNAQTILDGLTGGLEDRLSGREFLVGDHLSVADIVVAAPLYLADLTEANAAGHPVTVVFGANLRIAEQHTKTRAWVRRIMAHDPVSGTR